jgi:hypothetical protein
MNSLGLNRWISFMICFEYNDTQAVTPLLWLDLDSHGKDNPISISFETNMEATLSGRKNDPETLISLNRRSILKWMNETSYSPVVLPFFSSLFILESDFLIIFVACRSAVSDGHFGLGVRFVIADSFLSIVHREPWLSVNSGELFMFSSFQ